MGEQINQRIKDLIQKDKVFLFMKGDPTFPQCGFSNQVVQILKGFEIPFGHFDVLSDAEIRQGIKDFSDWPTIPQLYIDQEFVGGCDIVRESWESGDLLDMLKNAFPEQDIKAPVPPAQVNQIDPATVKAMMEKEGVKFLDVRSPQERAIVTLEPFLLLDQAMARVIMDSWDRNTEMVFLCHYGARSQQAAQFFSEQGFQNLYNVAGGLEAWSQVDPTIQRY